MKEQDYFIYSTPKERMKYMLTEFYKWLNKLHTKELKGGVGIGTKFR